jgi:hypothetical protein
MCHAQAGCSQPTSATIVPDTWYAGVMNIVTITTPNVNIFNIGYYCDSVDLTTGSGAEIPVTWEDISGTADSATIGVEPAASVPTQTALFVLESFCDPDANMPCPAGTGANDIVWKVTFPVQIVGCPAPAITSVTPSGWWAGQQQDITITGNCFVTLSDPSGPSKVTVTDGAGAVTLSNVTVVGPNQITATVNVTKKAPAETVTLKVTNPPSGGGPQSVTASPAPVVLPVPVIKWKGNAISGDSTKNQSVIVGQPVELTTTPATLPGGFTVSKSTWDIDGTTIKQYQGDASGITLQETDLDTQNTTYYWLYPDSGLNVTYTYCATDTNGNQICTSPQAKATYKATRPTMTLSTWDSKEATIEHFTECAYHNEKEPYLGYGDLSGPVLGCPGDQEGTVGIKLTASGASGGKYVFVQIVDSDFGLYTYPAPAGGGAAPPPDLCGPHAGLDGGMPFPGVYKDDPSVAYDGPELPLDIGTEPATATRNFHATMYLLWQPDQLSGTNTESIPVPIGHQDWQFIATAFHKPPPGRDKWSTSRTPTASGDEGEGFVPATPSDNELYGYPLWAHLASTVCNVSQWIN